MLRKPKKQKTFLVSKEVPEEFRILYGYRLGINLRELEIVKQKARVVKLTTKLIELDPEAEDKEAFNYKKRQKKDNLDKPVLVPWPHMELFYISFKENDLHIEREIKSVAKNYIDKLIEAYYDLSDKLDNLPVKYYE